MQLLKQICLKNWKSIEEETIEFGKLNVIVGANGAGKSNLISVFRMLNVMFAHQPGFRNYVGESGGADALLHYGRKTSPTAELQLSFATETVETRYVAQWAAAAQDTLIFTDERVELQSDGHSSPLVIHVGAGQPESQLPDHCQRHQDETARIGLLLVRGCRLYHFHDTSSEAAIRGSSYIEANRFLTPDASNLASMLYLFEKKHPDAYFSITAVAKQLIPGFHSFFLEPSKLNEKQILLKWFQVGSDYEFGPHQLSDGSIRLLALATLFLQPPEFMPRLIAIDEPELGLHPSALSILADLVRDASSHCQVILATQSSLLLDYFDASDVIVTQSVNGHTSFNRLYGSELELWLDEYSLGEVWEKNVFGGGPYG